MRRHRRPPFPCPPPCDASSKASPCWGLAAARLTSPAAAAPLSPHCFVAACDCQHYFSQHPPVKPNPLFIHSGTRCTERGGAPRLCLHPPPCTLSAAAFLFSALPTLAGFPLAQRPIEALNKSRTTASATVSHARRQALFRAHTVKAASGSLQSGPPRTAQTKETSHVRVR